MTFLEVQDKINHIKKNYGRLTSNILLPNVREAEIEQVFENEKALVFTVNEPYRKRGYFAGADVQSLSDVLQKLPKDTVVEYLFRRENDMKKCFEIGGLKEYACYIRRTWVYTANPYEVPETGRRRLLQELYDPNFGEYAQMSDVDELYNLVKDIFDPVCDDIFTPEHWQEIINNKECLLYRENGEIITFYVWRYEGRKLYNNMTVNLGPANYLYNLERRVFDEKWQWGNRVYYAWVNMNNQRSLKRENHKIGDALKSVEVVYDGIYIK